MKKFFGLIFALIMTLSLSVVAWGETVANCPGNCNHVATIGTTHYDTIQAAVEAAADKDVITVIADHAMDITKGVTNSGDYYTMVNVADKSVTVDLNGCNITLDVTNLPAGKKSDMLLGVFAADTDGVLTLKDGKGTGSVSVTGGAAKTVYSLVIAYDGLVNIEGGNYSVDYMNKGRGMIYGNVGDSANADGSNKERGVNISGGTFTLGNVGTLANGSPWILATAGNNSGKHVFVNGGTFKAEINRQHWIFEVKVSLNKAMKNNGDGTWTVVDAVVYVNEPEESGNWYIHQVGYATIKDAADGAKNNKSDIETHPNKNQIAYDKKENVIVTNKPGTTEETIETYKIFNLINPPASLTVRANGVAATVVELNAITPTIPASVQYGYSTDGNFPEHSSTVWQDSTLFTGLTASTAYTFFARYADKDDPSAAFVVSETTATTAAAPTNVFVGGDAAGDAPEQVAPVDRTITLPENTFDKDGFVFDGWSDGTNTYQPGDTYIMPEGEDVVFTPLWKEEVTTPPTPPTPPYYGGNITEDTEEPPEEKPAETKPVEEPVTPPAEEEVVTPKPEDTTPVVPDEPVVDEPVVDESPVDDAPQQGSVAVWVGIGGAAVAAGGCAIVFGRKRIR